MSKFNVGQHVVIGTHYPAYGAFSNERESGTPILGLGVLIRAVDSWWTIEDGKTITDCLVQAHPTMADAKIAGTIQVLREEDLVGDLRSKFQPGQRVRVVAKVPSHGAWSNYIAHGAEGVVRRYSGARPQSREYPSGFVVTVRLDGTSYDQNVNPEDLEPPGELTVSRVNITSITETQTVQVGQTFTVTLSEREAAVLAYLLGHIPLSLLDYNTTLYDSLVAVIGDDTADWEGPSNILPDLVDAAKILARLGAYSNRYK